MHCPMNRAWLKVGMITLIRGEDIVGAKAFSGLGKWLRLVFSEA